MDREAALLIIAKDLFLKAWETKAFPKEAKITHAGKETEYFADEFLIFYKKLRSGLGN